MNLVIVESPAKAKTIEKYLGSGYKVRASMGHISDLPSKELAIDIEHGFKPKYATIAGKSKLVKELKEYAQKSERILLATDPDREGEMIAQHLATALGKGKPIARVMFHEITQSAILKAVQNPQAINKNLVAAQQARRVLDRLVGYKISPFLWKALQGYSGLSAGRVQSAALRLICEREVAISDFVPQEYWSLDALFESMNHERFAARLYQYQGQTIGSPAQKGTQFIIRDAEAAQILADRARNEVYHIAKIQKKTIHRTPPPPFTTSTLQQAASNRLGINTKQTMRLAQQLYEGVDLENGESVGLITYMRTDSTRLADEAIAAIRDLIANDFGTNYLPAKPHSFGAKQAKNAQEAHEAIRPTDVRRTPQAVRKFLSPEQFKLYSLIWQRTVASQMAAAIIDQTTVDIASAKNDFVFRAVGSVVRFRGFLQLYDDHPDEQKAKSSEEKSKEGAPSSEASDLNPNQRLPESLAENQSATLVELGTKQHFTKPPPRYTEATLVKALEEKGIGRPSTYSSIVHTLQDRNYATIQKKQFHAEDLGMKVNHILVSAFPDLFDLQFTAQMEADLDKIALGNMSYLDAMNTFYHQKLDPALQRASLGAQGMRAQQMPFQNIASQNIAPNTAYQNAASKNVAPKNIAQKVEKPCPQCGRALILREGKFGAFFACSGFPQCRHTEAVVAANAVACPVCKRGHLAEKKTKDGRVFYSCSSFPTCKHALWDRPINQECSHCKHYFIVEHTDRTGNKNLQCPQCHKRI
jgi:DNA topoisomerase-1